MVAYAANRSDPFISNSYVRSISIDTECGLGRIETPYTSHFAWSPDSRKLAIASPTNSGYWDVAVAGICNGEAGFPSLPTITPRKISNELGANGGLPALNNYPWFTWSPNGQVIAFYDHSRSAIRGLIPNTIGTATIGTLVDVSNLSAVSYLDYSPDGLSLVFMGRAGSDEFPGWTERIYTADLSTSLAVPVAITETSVQADWPVRSPDGSKILFGGTATNTGTWELYTMAADGTQLNQITVGGQNFGPASWSPAGSHIVYMSKELDTGDIYIIESSGANKTRVTTNSSRDREPQWVP